MLTTIGIALALTAVLNMLKIYKFPQGGGITLGSMIPIILIAYAYGPLVGMLTGFLFGIISLFIDPYFISGVVFFGSFAPEGMSPILYSFLVNGSLIGADGLICVVLLGILPVNRLIKAISSKSVTSKYAS